MRQMPQRIRELIDELVIDRQLVTGAALALRGRRWDATYCCGDNGAGVPMSEDALFDLASVTKLFTAIVFLALDERGLLRINEPLGRYTDAFPHIRELRIADLMFFTVDLQTPKRIDSCASEEEALQVLYAVEGKPSPVQRYSDIPAMVLAELLECATGRTFWSWLDELIVQPLGIEDLLSWRDPRLHRPGQLLMDYSGELRIVNDEPVRVPPAPAGTVHDPKARKLNRLCGNAGLFGSTRALAQVAEGLLEGRIISVESCRRLVRGESWEARAQVTTFGYCCYRRNEQSAYYSDLPLIAGRHSLASTGFTGTYLAVDFDNGGYVVLNANRLHNRVSKVIASNRECGERVLVDGTGHVNSSGYVYERHPAVDACFEEILDQKRSME
ncbi:MAG: serine hydrolase [Coriobacteriaceae bacterium]|nr:serine hydrolase [Coriobacteriaceae bacterium]MDD6768922.1 serine hydrolase [Coriobacteriaceae bacterium]